MLRDLLPNDWQSLLSDEFQKEYFTTLDQKVTEAYENHITFPKESHIFEAFKRTAYHDVKVVIFGQDPYHGENQAHGLAFSVEIEKLPPSLRNIYKELKEDLGIERTTGILSDWADQGVLLLNDVLTVEKASPRSHRKYGWIQFTEAVVHILNQRQDPVIFVLWGNDAIKKEKMIASHHFIIKGPHPSPLSAYRGFFGSKPFSKINDILIKLGKRPIEW